MNKRSRTANVTINIFGSLGGRIFSSILQFVCRTYFIRLLSKEYLGVNGLFSNILSLLSLAELGIGQAIVFSMYKPIAEDDELHIAKLMNFYRFAYRIIGIIVACIGASLIPFLDFFVKDATGIEDLRLIFTLILSNTVVSYFMIYKSSMLTADQKAYTLVIIRNLFSVLVNVCQIFILIWTRNYLLYLTVNILFTILTNLTISLYVDYKYPFLKKHRHETIEKGERREIFKKIRGLMMHKMGGFVLNSTDNLVLSKFVGIVQVGIYSNYYMIVTLIKGYLDSIVGSLSASIGNLIASESKEKSYSVFKTTFFVHFWLYSFCFVCFWVIFQPFVELWIGDQFLIDGLTLMMVLLVFYLYGVQHAHDVFSNASGIFWETRWKPVLESTINIVSSIYLAIKIGMPGVFVGSVLAFVATGWIGPIYLYRKAFGSSSIRYIARFSLYLGITLANAIVLNKLCGMVRIDNLFLQIVFRTVASIIFPNLVIILLFFKTKEFNAVTVYAKSIFRKIKK